MLSGFIATTKALTSPVAGGMRPMALWGRLVPHVHPGVSTTGSPCLLRLTFRPFRLQPPPRHFAAIGLSRYITVGGSPRLSLQADFAGRWDHFARTRVRTFLADSPTGLAESSSHMHYGLVIHLRLLSTLPYGNAVTLGYRLVT